MKPIEPTPIIVRKSVKHVFNQDERNTMHNDLLTALETHNAAEAEFDSIKASYKAKITEAESRTASLAATLRAGFEMRVKELEVRYRPTDKKKDFYLPVGDTGNPNGAPVLLLTEDMTQEDFEQDLIRAESIFSKKSEIELWNAGQDRGILVVGQLNDRWFSAVRGVIGQQKIEERLDSEQRSFKVRYDAIGRASKRCLEWLTEICGKDNAKGFTDAINTKVDAEKEKVE